MLIFNKINLFCVKKETPSRFEIGLLNRTIPWSNGGSLLDYTWPYTVDPF